MLFNRCSFYDLPDEAALTRGEKGFTCAHEKTLSWETARKALGLGPYSAVTPSLSSLLAPPRRIYRTRAKK